MITLRYLRCNGARVLIRYQPVDGVVYHPGSGRDVGGGIAWKGRGTLDTQSGKTTAISRLMQHAGRMDGVIEVPHEPGRFVVAHQPLQCRDRTAALFDARGLTQVGLCSLSLRGEVRRTHKYGAILLRYLQPHPEETTMLFEAADDGA